MLVRLSFDSMFFKHKYNLSMMLTYKCACVFLCPTCPCFENQLHQGLAFFSHVHIWLTNKNHSIWVSLSFSISCQINICFQYFNVRRVCSWLTKQQGKLFDYGTLLGRLDDLEKSGMSFFIIIISNRRSKLIQKHLYVDPSKKEKQMIRYARKEQHTSSTYGERERGKKGAWRMRCTIALI